MLAKKIALAHINQASKSFFHKDYYGALETLDLADFIVDAYKEDPKDHDACELFKVYKAIEGYCYKEIGELEKSIAAFDDLLNAGARGDTATLARMEINQMYERLGN